MNARLLCAELVEVIWRDPSGRERHRIGHLEDISSTGLCLQMEVPISTETNITMRYNGDGELVGVVRYSACREDAYYLGVQLSDGCRWSSKHFRPQHLMDPRDLVEQSLMRRTGTNRSGAVQ